MNDWIEYGKPWSEFRRDDLNKSWTIIQIRPINRDSDILLRLLGDFSKEGGQCDCCSGIMRDDIIVRYKNIITEH